MGTTEGTYRFYAASISWEHHTPKHDRETLERVRGLLASRGYTWGTDPRVLQYKSKSMREDYLRGKGWWLNINATGEKASLEFQVEIHPACSSIKFFQNYVLENPNGGEYGFHPLENMTYLLRMRFFLIRREIAKVLKDCGYKDANGPTGLTMVEQIMHERENSWHRNSYAHPEPSGSRGGDGALMKDGDIRYFRDRSGVWMRCAVYYSLNWMWKGVTSVYPYPLQQGMGVYFSSISGPRRSKPGWANRVEVLIQAAVKNRNFKHAAILQDYMDRRKAEESTRKLAPVSESRCA